MGVSDPTSLYGSVEPQRAKHRHIERFGNVNCKQEIFSILFLVLKTGNRSMGRWSCCKQHIWELAERERERESSLNLTAHKTIEQSKHEGTKRHACLHKAQSTICMCARCPQCQLPGLCTQFFLLHHIWRSCCFFFLFHNRPCWCLGVQATCNLAMATATTNIQQHLSNGESHIESPCQSFSSDANRLKYKWAKLSQNPNAPSSRSGPARCCCHSAV